MKILIVGASGLVGGQCYKILEGDICGTHITFPTNYTIPFNPSNIQDFANLPHNNWDIIIHTGALTHVDKCEEEIELSYHSTVQSTINLVEYCKSMNCKFIYISSDYVFDGENGPYTEDQPTNPKNIYGRHKLLAEQEVIKHLENYLIFRITNVYGDEIRNKNYIARTLKAINFGERTFKAPDDQFATPINASDVARAIQTSIDKDLTGLYHLSGTDYMSRVQLLQVINRYFKDLDMNIVPVNTQELNQRAKRPLLGGLIAKKFLSAIPDFAFTNLDNYLNDKIYDKEY